jgi:transglutaminase-like putative cysteine protease
MRASLSHQTLYQYDRLVNLGPQTIRLRPLDHCPCPVLFYALTLEPNGHEARWGLDALGNACLEVLFDQKVRRFGLTVDLVVDLGEPQQSAGVDVPLAAPVTEADQHHMAAYRYGVDDAPALAAYLEAGALPSLPALSDAKQCNEKVHREMRYLVREEQGIQNPTQTLALRSGSCRDTTWLLVQLLRQRGYAARFVSGYLIELQCDHGKGATGIVPTQTELHAWCEVLVPNLGWIGLDPTSGLFAGHGHIPLALGAYPGDAAPLQGYLEHCNVDFSFSMQVRAIA